MEQEKRVIVSALYSAPRSGHTPRKARSSVVVGLGQTRRRLMFNETDIANADFNVTFNSGRGKVKMIEEDTHVIGPRTPSPATRESAYFNSRKRGGKLDDTSLLGKRRRLLFDETEKDIAEHKDLNSRRANVKFKDNNLVKLGSEKNGKQYEQTVSVSYKQRDQQVVVVPEEAPKENLIHLAKLVENAPYFTRFLKNLVIDKLTYAQEKYHKRVSFKHLKKKTKKSPLSDPNVEREAARAWSLLLSKGKAESIGSAWDEVDGICREVLFISKVCYVQGSRLYQPWKGSVLDSIIGALLTQRVRDGISSSAFIALSMTFPQFGTCNLYSRHHRILRKKRQHSGKQISLPFDVMNTMISSKRKSIRKEKPSSDWNKLRADCSKGKEIVRDSDKIDFVDWHAAKRAHVDHIAENILSRGMEQKLATRIKGFLNRLMSDQGNLDLEWLREASCQEAKDFLLSIHGIGLKSAECIRLLTLRQPAFPVDVHVARVMVRLGWVPAPQISDDILMDLLRQSSKLHELIQGYIWPRLSKLDADILYELHCQMITFGKVYCSRKPKCGECPMRLKCRYYSDIVNKPSSSVQEIDIEDMGGSRTSAVKAKPLKSACERTKCKVKKETAICVIPNDSIAVPKTPIKLTLPRKKNASGKVKKAAISKSRREHFIYELPDYHPILETFDDRDPDDPCPYLLVTWEIDLEKPEQTSNNEPPSNSYVRGSRTIPGTIMIPCRTALKGNFPLNGTYFQPNEVFADRETSKIPVDVSRRTLEGAPTKTLYCGDNLGVMVKGGSTNDIRRFFHKDYMCTRSFDRVTYATKRLDGRLRTPFNTGKRTLNG